MLATVPSVEVDSVETNDPPSDGVPRTAVVVDTCIVSLSLNLVDGGGVKVFDRVRGKIFQSSS